MKGVFYEGGKTRRKERVLLKGNIEENFNKEYLQKVLQEWIEVKLKAGKV